MRFFQAIIIDVLISGFAAGFKLGTHFELLIEYNVLYMLTEINFVDRTVLYMIDTPPQTIELLKLQSRFLKANRNTYMHHAAQFPQT